MEGGGGGLLKSEVAKDLDGAEEERKGLIRSSFEAASVPSLLLLPLPYLSPLSFPSPPSFPQKIAKKVGASRRQTLPLRWLFVPGLSIFLPLLLCPSAVLGARLACFWRCPKLFCRKGDARLIFGPRLILRTSCSEPHTVRAQQKILLSPHD